MPISVRAVAWHELRRRVRAWHVRPTLGLLAMLAVLGASPAQPARADSDASTAAVEIDGRVLFRVGGVSAYPAAKRAAAIAGRIRALAEDPHFDTRNIRIVETEHSSDLVGDSRPIASLFEADAAAEGLERQPLAIVYSQRVREAINQYRHERTDAFLRSAAWHAAAATLAFAFALWLVLWPTQRLINFAVTRYEGRVQSVAVQSLELVGAERIEATIRGTLRALSYLAAAVLAFLYVYCVLDMFPWTRLMSRRLLGYVLDPLREIGEGFEHALPKLIILAVFGIAAYFAIRLVRLFFEAVERGAVKLENFEPDWAMPTYRIARTVILVFAAVVAYPYIPGSESAAFKGVTIFFGVLLSIGSSSYIANIVAGYALTYRRAFRIGDLVKMDDLVALVVRKRLHVTHLRTLKNEEVTVPNSLILSGKILNFSSLARSPGLILHTSVGIGYEVPWRQVEAMLLMAAERTPGLLREPAAFVLERSLDEFAVTYELNAYCSTPTAMPSVYAALHRNVLDVFNEYSVQIMTPAYRTDPSERKIVRKEHWYASPARRDASQHAADE